MYLVPPWSNLCHSAQSVFPLSCLRLLREILLRTAEAINRTSFQREGVFLSGTALPEEKTKLERKESRALEAALLRMFPINPRQTLK